MANIVMVQLWLLQQYQNNNAARKTDVKIKMKKKFSQIYHVSLKTNLVSLKTLSMSLPSCAIWGSTNL